LDFGIWDLFGPIVRSGGACNLYFALVGSYKVSSMIRLAVFLASGLARVKHFKSWRWFSPGPLRILQVELSLRQDLLGFVVLNPTYILPVLIRNVKSNNDLLASNGK
jgi:hypothetical protein